MAKHFEYELTLPQEPEHAFRVLLDSDAWGRSRVYGSVRWVKGEPWRIDSEREVETLVPYRSKHRQKVLSYRENERVGLISHGFGYTMQTEIRLKPATTGGSEVRYLIDIEGAMPLLFGFAIDDFVARFMEIHMAELKRLCEEATGAAPRI